MLPFVGDDRAHLEAVITATKDPGGSFVMGGGVSMDGAQARRTLEAFRRFDPNDVPVLRELDGW